MAIYYKDKLVAGAGGTPDALPLAGGTMTGEIDMGGNKVTNLPAPTAELDAVTKAYLDAAIVQAVAEYLPLSGSTMTGEINMNGNRITWLPTPTQQTHAATKGYVDSKILPTDNYLPLNGGTMTGSIDMGSHDITGLPAVPASDGAISRSFAHTTYINRAGSQPMQGDLNLGTNKIINVKNPTASSDAATKSYVDAVALSIYIGTYTGSGTAQTISLFNSPQFVLIFEDGALPSSSQTTMPIAFATQQFAFGRLSLNGSVISIDGASDGINQNNRHYVYVAFV